MSPDYFDQLETELRLAVRRAAHEISGGASLDVASRSGGSRWRPRLRVRLSGPILALNAVVIIAVALVLIGVLGHRHGARHNTIAPATAHHRVQRGGGAGANTFVYPPGAVPTLPELLHSFAILRRPQTAADRSWRPNCDCGNAARQLYQYTRLARTLPGGYRVFFDLEQFNTGGQLNMAAGSYVMEYDVVSPNGDTSSAAFGPNTQFTVYPSAAGDNIYVSIVPDGVATVSWRFTCRGTTRQCAGVEPRTVTVPVAGNVAAERVLSGACPAPGEAIRRARQDHKRPLAALTGCLMSHQTTWRAADGRVVASFPNGYGNLPAPPFVNGSRGARDLRILHPRGVGEADIGESFSTATRTLDQLLGPAAVTHVSVPQTGCGIDFESVWTSPAVASPLTLYERDGYFVGYQYGAPVTEIGLVQGPGAVLFTADGLTIGNTVRVARRLYGSAFSAHAISAGSHSNGGGVWRGTGDGGALSGALQPVRYPMRVVTAANPIATISAGQTGCPSVS